MTVTAPFRARGRARKAIENYLVYGNSCSSSHTAANQKHTDRSTHPPTAPPRSSDLGPLPPPVWRSALLLALPFWSIRLCGIAVKLFRSGPFSSTCLPSFFLTWYYTILLYYSTVLHCTVWRRSHVGERSEENKGKAYFRDGTSIRSPYIYIIVYQYHSVSNFLI